MPEVVVFRDYAQGVAEDWHSFILAIGRPMFVP